MAKVNRFAKTQTTTYQPRTLQELMMVPAYKRKQHDELSAGIAEYETQLAQSDAADEHMDALGERQDLLYTKMQEQRDKLNKEGFSQSAKSDFIRFNKEYQKEIGPQGQIGQIKKAKEVLDANKAAFYKDGFAKGHSKDILDKNWETFRSNYTGFNERGDIENIGELGASLMFDIQKDVMDAATRIGETQLVNIDNVTVKSVQTPNGTELQFLDKQTGLKVDNHDQVAALGKSLIGDYLNPNTSRGQFSKFTGLNPEDIANTINNYLDTIKKDKQTLQRSATPLKTPTGGGNPTGDDNPSTSAISTGQRIIAKNAADLSNKLSNLEQRKSILASSAVPGAKEEYDLTVKEERKLNRLKEESEHSIKDDEKLTRLQKEAENNERLFQQMETQALANIEQLENEGDAEKARFLKDRLEKARRGEDVTIVADTDKLTGGEEFEFYDNMSSLKNASLKAEKYKNELITGYLQRHGQEEVEFITSSKDSEDKVLFNNLNKVLSSVDFDIKYIEGLEGYEDIDFSKNSRYSKVQQSVKDLIATSSNSVINFGTDGNNPFLSITATPKKDTQLDTYGFWDGRGDDVPDVKFDGGKRFTAKVPLVRYNNRNVPQMTDFAVHLLNNSQLDTKTKNAIKKSIFTAGVSSTSNKEKLGETMVGANYLGDYANKVHEEGYIGIDFYKPLGPNSPMQVFKIKTDGTNSPVSVGDILPINNSAKSEEILDKSGLAVLYRNYAAGTKVSDFKSLFNDSLSEKSLNTLTNVDGNRTVAEAYNLSPTMSRGEIDNFLNLIKELPLMVKDASSLLNLSNSISY